MRDGNVANQKLNVAEAEDDMQSESTNEAWTHGGTNGDVGNEDLVVDDFVTGIGPLTHTPRVVSKKHIAVMGGRPCGRWDPDCPVTSGMHEFMNELD